jgi:hypothetical protein
LETFSDWTGDLPDRRSILHSRVVVGGLLIEVLAIIAWKAGQQLMRIDF